MQRLANDFHEGAAGFRTQKDSRLWMVRTVGGRLDAADVRGGLRFSYRARVRHQRLQRTVAPFLLLVIEMHIYSYLLLKESQ